MPVYKCSQCLPTNVPNYWTKEKKAEVASLIRKMGSIFAIQYFRPVGMDFSDTKNISLHVTKRKGHCHYCETELAEYEGNCPKCNRLNLNW